MMRQKIFDFTKNGKCSRCGQCCSDILPLSKYEVHQIKRYIKLHNIKEQRHNVSMRRDLSCPFRDEQYKKCTIYEVRPNICREFMCNHTEEDIMKSKLNFHATHDVVFMRNTFFNSKEDENLLESLLEEMRNEKGSCKHED